MRTLPREVRKSLNLARWPTVLVLCGGLLPSNLGGPPSAAAQSAAPAAAFAATGAVEGGTIAGRDAEVRFMSAMLTHHAEGIALMELAETRAGTPRLRTLAARIRSNFEDESTTIAFWLSDHREPVADGKSEFFGADAGHTAFGPGFGVVSPRKVVDLQAASGEEFDRLFLDRAIQYHSAAIHLVEDLLTAAPGLRDETVLLVAANVRGEHTAYAASMERMYRAKPR